MSLSKTVRDEASRMADAAVPAVKNICQCKKSRCLLIAGLATLLAASIAMHIVTCCRQHR